MKEKLKKSKISNLNVTTAVKKKYINAINHWEDKNDRVCDIINFSIEQRFKIHVNNIKITMWVILKNQYDQLNLTTLHLTIRKLT